MQSSPDKHADKKSNSDIVPEDALVKSANLFPVVGIGASAGGLDAFRKLLKAIPEDSGMAYVLVQHLDPNHESLLPEILQKVTRIPVLEITDDLKVLPDHIYVIPSNKMMAATDGILMLTPRPAKSKTERNLPIDLFFASLAEVHQDHAIGVVLSGTATDGTLGLKAIKEHGGITFAQDEASAEYDSMPHSAAQAGVVDFILPPELIPKKLLEVTAKTILSDEALQNIPKQEEDVFKQILSLLRIRKGVDFTYYKQTTIRRRILRRMVVNKNEEAADYLKYLRADTAEQDMLYQDMLIPVTSFFRDKKTFDNLCNQVFPAIIKDKIPGQITRIWVAGCSTGQEVYSFAICFKEFLGEHHERIQIFGTDLSEPAITKARSGIYEKTEVDSVSPQRLKDYFVKNNGGYQVIKTIRDLCVFAHHNFLKDPPFGKMDCISCRNVLIYMEPYLQKKALTTFHYALNPKGFLLLGKSETTGGVPELFAAASSIDKLYTRKDVPARFMQVTSQRSELILGRAIENSKNEIIRTDFQKTADDILLTKYTPAGVVVNEAMDIVHFRGNTSNYLEQAPGKPSHNLLMMAKHGLGFELRNILHKAKTDRAAVVKENIPLHVNGAIRNISIEAVPLPNTVEPYYLVLFHDYNATDANGFITSPGKKVSVKTKQDEKDIRIQLLEQELSQLREDMRSITEEQEANNEELQSANEELLSGSEELQSLNEELETSKEELQSTNEELTVLNNELIGLNEQVTDARNYSESIVATIYQPLLVLDKHLRVKTANKSFYKTFNVNEQETEGILVYDLGNRQWNIPELRNMLEEILPQKKRITDFEVTHDFSSIGERSILLNALEISSQQKGEKLILLSIEDITEKKVVEKDLIENTIRFRQLVKDLPAAVYSCDAEGFITFYNEAAVRIWGRHPVIGKDRWCGSWKILSADGTMLPLDASPMAVAIKDGHAKTGEEIIIQRKDGSQSNVLVYPQPEFGLSGRITGATNIIFDISEQVVARKKMQMQADMVTNLLLTAPAFICTLTGPDHVYDLVNERYQSLFGKRKIQGKAIMVALPELEGQGFDTLLDKVYTTGEPYVGINILISLARDEGLAPEERYFNFSYQPMYDEYKNIFSILVFGYEVTPQVIAAKKIEKSEAFNRAVLEGSPDCIKMLDAEGRLQFMNANGICLLEIDDFKTVENSYWWDMWEPENRPIIKDAVAKAKEGEKIQLQLFSPTAKGTPKWWDIIVLPVLEDGTDKNHQRILSVSRDITQQKLNELKEKELLTRFQTLVLEAPVAICVLRGRDYVIEIINEGMVEMWGKRSEEVLNKPAFDVLPELLEQGFKKLLDTVYNSGERYVTQELPINLQRHRKLENAYVKFVYEPLRNADGTVSGVMALAHEITEQVVSRKKIEESESHFRKLADLMPAKISNAAPDGEVTYFNQSWLDYTGMSFTELKEFGYHKIIHPAEIEEFQQRFQRAAETKTVLDMEMRFLNKEGNYKWHSNLASPISDEMGKIKMWVGVTIEIQEQKEKREELEKAVQERTSELLDVNNDLKEKNNQFEKINKELESFTYIASHDLQEPLRKIRTFADRIYQKESEQLSEKGKDYFKRIQSAAARMQQLIEDLLTFSRLNIAEIKFEDTGLNSIIEEVKTELKEIIEEKKAIIEATELCAATIIPFQFRQLIQNLVSNALKFSKPGVPPHITIKSKIAEGAQFLKEKKELSAHDISPEKKYCCITVSDNGIGFDIQYKDQVFEVFERLHGRDEYSGTGIGLSIVKKIVENHNGIILVESELGNGTTFDIYIPHTE